MRELNTKAKISFPRCPYKTPPKFIPKHTKTLSKAYRLRAKTCIPNRNSLSGDLNTVCERAVVDPSDRLNVWYSPALQWQRKPA
jgi:hypothetical protein